MASIQRIKSPLTGAISYRAQVRVKGRPAQSETFPNIKEAKAWATGLEAAIRESRHHPHLAGGKTSFDGLVKRYTDNVLAAAKEQTKNDRENHLEWFKARFAGLTLAEITPDKIAEARDALAAEKYRRGPDKFDEAGNLKRAAKEYARSGATVNRYLATLSHMMNTAKKEWRLIPSNPVSDISKKREGRGRTRFLSDAERDLLLDACAKSDWPQLHTLVVLAISTGARRSELISLKWSDLDLKAGTALVSETKNGEQRTLPLVGKAKGELQVLKELREEKLKSGGVSEYVFPNPSGHTGPFAQFDHRWYDALKLAGIEGFRFHDLRHCCASYLAANGASLLEIADVLGHKTLAMVRRYSHLTKSHKASVVERMVQAQGL